MGEKIKSEPTTREQRRPILDAARAGDSQKIDVALAQLTDGQLENIRFLCRTEWGNILRGDVVLLLERMDALTTARKSTHDSAVKTAGVQAPTTDTPQPEPPKQSTSLPPPQAATRPSAPAPAPAPTPQGPSRGIRTMPAAPPKSTYVAEGMRR